MAKSFAVFLVLFLILRSQTVNTKTLEAFLKDLETYERSIKSNEEELNKLAIELNAGMESMDCTETDKAMDSRLLEMKNQLANSEYRWMNHILEIENKHKQQMATYKTVLDNKNVAIETFTKGLIDLKSKLQSQLSINADQLNKIQVKNNEIYQLKKQLDEMNALKRQSTINRQQLSDCQNKIFAIDKLKEQVPKVESQLKSSTPKALASSCSSANGIQLIQVEGAKAFHVLCKQSINGSSWIVIQKRNHLGVSFERNWNEYKTGFGRYQSEFFFGLEKIFFITFTKQYELYIELTDYDNYMFYAYYDFFRVGSNVDGYRLYLGNYRGNATDGMASSRNQKFTTTRNLCVIKPSGGWWFPPYSCNETNLNRGTSPVWSVNGSLRNMKAVSMMIRPKQSRH
ncbi:angiopoietin-1-like [Drosophila hydei]|uniref:Angiopoietin-1-like n=1 Tax=Drosophila hydei TaxID=7224 RepID=A0A6J1LLG6_DROHY|nr:angiopoietin-1-like [Drosophila hydei]